MVFLLTLYLAGLRSSAGIVAPLCWGGRGGGLSDRRPGAVRADDCRGVAPERRSALLRGAAAGRCVGAVWVTGSRVSWRWSEFSAEPVAASTPVGGVAKRGTWRSSSASRAGAARSMAHVRPASSDARMTRAAGGSAAQSSMPHMTSHFLIAAKITKKGESFFFVPLFLCSKLDFPVFCVSLPSLSSSD